MKILVYSKSLLTFLFKVSNHSHFRHYFLIFSFSSILHGQVTPTTLSVVATGTNVSYQWYSNTLNSTSNAFLIVSATSSSYTPPPFTGIRYYFVVVEDDCGAAITSTVVTVQISANHTWNGSQSTDWNTAAN